MEKTVSKDATSPSSSSESTKSSETEFEKSLHQSYAFDKCTTWTSGQLTDIRVVPRLTLLGAVGERNPHTETLDGLIQVYSTPHYSFYPSQDREPFFSLEKPIRPTVISPRETKDIPEVSSLQELYRWEQLDSYSGLRKVNDDNIILVTAQGPEPKRDGRIALTNIYKVTYEVVATLKSSELITSQEVSILTTDSISNLSTFQYDSFFEQNTVQIEFKKNEDNEVSIRKPSDNAYINQKQKGKARLLSRGLSLSPLIPVLFSSLNILFKAAIIILLLPILYKVSNRVVSLLEQFSVANPVQGELLENDPIGLDYQTARNRVEKQKNIQRKFTEFKSKLKEIPREVTVELKSNDRIDAVERDLSWNISEGELIDTDAIDFFVEYGFEEIEEEDQITTHMIQSKEAIPDYLPHIKGTDGWYLLPEKVERNTY